MKFQFKAYGHPNILGTHKTTLEFTKDKEVSLKGDCIVGVKADFDLSKIKEFIKKSNNNNKIIITIEAIDKIKEMISAEINPNFKSAKELVIRTTDFVSERTFAINADKASVDLDRSLTEFLKRKDSKVSVNVEFNG